MSVWEFFVNNWQETLHLATQHFTFVTIAVLIAIVTGVPIGIWISFNRKAAEVVLYLAGIIMTIPSIALFGIMIPILSVFGYGIGTVPAVVALVLYSQLPIIRNTYAALNAVDPAIIDAGTGMGMTRRQVLFKVQIPMALSVIFAGVRVAVVMSIGIGAIAAFIGAGGLGHYIFMGINQSYDAMVNAGALTVAVMAVVTDYLFGLAEKRMVSKGLRNER
ncbi:osmoprotectant transport system permease protein [Desulfacinum infernum DSM 9756]|uniref:Osmoprotectant transport system permease protein n=1 Tax=Desulfacinum infernum DSM 9756 TaxID=1121391 RepID=A0A1M5HHI4_9BACT|nr:ABC transporter permease [Desulfacinum infernum]SHG15434.1 osmoprotectant transport system permease protein [Desulfacinum infernum DSM 9756]